MSRPELTVRRAGADDIGAAIATATAALGWNPAEPNEALFRWKHLDNPAGPSPMWVAVDGNEVAGFRTMLRWRFRRDDTTIAAVRAVDTATHPDHQRRGAFRILTTAAVDELTAEGVGFVFNTPNDNSRPGYLKMGWRELGRIPTRFALSSVAAIPRLARARTAATKWSEPCSLGDTVEHAADELADLVALTPAVDGLSTDRTVEHLRWRYGFEPLRYRLIRHGESAAIVRVRLRGPAREAVIAEIFSPGRAASRSLLRHVRSGLDVDHLLTLATPPHPAPWLPTIPRLGPRLTVRDLAARGPELDQFRFALGDIELF